MTDTLFPGWPEFTEVMHVLVASCLVYRNMFCVDLLLVENAMARELLGKRGNDDLRY